MIGPRLLPAFVLTVLVISMLACSLVSGSAPATATGEPAATDTPAGATESASIPANPTESVSTHTASSTGRACDNPLYPVVAGASWSYSISSSTIGNFTHSITDIRADGFTDQDNFTGGITRNGEWKCQDGALIALQPQNGSTAVVQTNTITATFTTTDLSGVTLPAAVNPGDTWKQHMVLEGTQTFSGLEVASKNETTYSCTAGGTESISVPAGTFDAIRLDCKTDTTITVTMGGETVPSNTSNTSQTWYAPDVGLVKSDTQISGVGDVIIELTAYSIP